MGCLVFIVSTANYKTLQYAVTGNNLVFLHVFERHGCFTEWTTFTPLEPLTKTISVKNMVLMTRSSADIFSHHELDHTNYTVRNFFHMRSRYFDTFQPPYQLSGFPLHLLRNQLRLDIICLH